MYTGNQTKFGQNKSKPILKLSVSDRMTSVFTIVVVVLQVGDETPSHGSCCWWRCFPRSGSR